MNDMISFEEAIHILQQHALRPKSEAVRIEHCVGRVLDEDILADRDFPPFDRVTMDGIAIHYKAFEEGQRQFPIEKICAAGEPQYTMQSSNTCVQIMTGAIMPHGADTVIRYEDITITDDQAVIHVDDVKNQQNVHFRGEDKKQNEVVLSKGVSLSAPDLIVAASVGKDTISVLALPKVALITTGNELVGINELPKAHQIRRSGNYGVQAILQAMHVDVTPFHIADDADLMQKHIHDLLTDFDMLIFTGGVSKGKFDFLPEVLEKLGVQKHFHKIKQRPGKPMWFGTSREGKPVFGLPGNPVSSLVCALVYVQIYMRFMLKQPIAFEYVTLGEDVHFEPELTYFLEVALVKTPDNEIVAQPKKGHGSGDFSNLSQTHGFIMLPEDEAHFKAGDRFPYLSYKKAFIGM